MHIIIVVHSGKPEAVAKSAELRDWLLARGMRVDVVSADEIITDGHFMEHNREILDDDPDLYFSLGGDGTLLSCAQMVFKAPAPVLGFNFGHLGFLTGASPDVMYEAVEAAIDGNLKSESRSALNIEIESRAGSRLCYTAFNEVAITRGVTGKMIEYELNIDGELLSTMRADGVIVSSASGSTAYSLSAGGPIISPTLSSMVVVALAPHSLVSRSFVTDDDQTVSILPEDKSNKDCSVFVDGNLVRMERSPNRVTATVRKDALTLLRYNVPGFTSLASRVFFGRTHD